MKSTDSAPTPSSNLYRPPVGKRLRLLLAVVFGLFALAAANAVYLLGVRLAGWLTGTSLEGQLYIVMFLVHLVLGLLIILPVLVFGALHLRNARRLPNRRAARVGYGLLTTAMVLIASGVVLTRLEGIIVVTDPAVRETAYWLHVATPLVAAWLFVLHRLAGRKIRWRIGVAWSAAAVGFTMLMLVWQLPEAIRRQAPVADERRFFPSLVRTASGDLIPAQALDNNDFCRECHAEVHQRWQMSAHRLSSFNNPPYRFSVLRTREVSMQRQGNVELARFCAGCHDLVPLLSGRFDDPSYDVDNDPTAHAGITCTVCHAVTEIGSARGNADLVISEPVQYPFADSASPFLSWLNRQLIKAKPELHKQTYLKPLHRSSELCGTCHKVHIPEELNQYKWLRGQNHYDSFLLSGVSGHGVASFYYPQQAAERCATCHMPLLPSQELGARDFGSGELAVHDHLFPGANTALPLLTSVTGAEVAVAAHQSFLEGAARVDLFGIRDGGTIDGRLQAPLRPELPVLQPGHTYLIETVIRTTRVGHLLTQGTADSNQLWLDIEVRSGGQVIGRSGGMNQDGFVDPWSHFVNAYVIDRDGNRIDRRNAEDIFVPLYDNQIPPGAADVVHLRLQAPEQAPGAVEIVASLRYRKFDTTYMRHVFGSDYRNQLPVTTIASDRVVLPVATDEWTGEYAPSPAPEWERWNDFGIGLLRRSGQGELRQAEAAFQRVEALGRAAGPLNLARLYLREGRVASEAPAALARAAGHDPPADPWSLLWFAALINHQNGRFDEAIADLKQIVDGGFAEAAGRGFDFSKDYRLLNQLGESTFQRALRERGRQRRDRRDALLTEAAGWYQRALELDPENLQAHWGLKQVLADLGDHEGAARHAAAHARYRPDDNARDRSMTAARRRDPAADHAAEAVVIYDLQRPGAYGLE
jgi:hypothetical protein